VPHMLLYHFNFGWPLIDEGTDLIWQGEWTSPGENNDKIFKEGNNFRKCPAPLEAHSGCSQYISPDRCTRNSYPVSLPINETIFPPGPGVNSALILSFSTTMLFLFLYFENLIFTAFFSLSSMGFRKFTNQPHDCFLYKRHTEPGASPKVSVIPLDSSSPVLVIISPLS
ncbi:MAG: aldose 1-epimerase family protein, partial [Bacteroidota bacterium]|nr:aldose 1-epimerase family protein [Bacteroidota bacterium]